MDEPLFSITSVRLTDSPGIRIMCGVSTESTIAESAFAVKASGDALAASIKRTKTTARE